MSATAPPNSKADAAPAKDARDAAGDTPVLRLEDVRAGYGPIEVLRGISLEVRPGEIVALIGANGAGKSTTLMSVAGVHRVRSGRVLFEGREIQSEPAHRLVAAGLAQVPEGRRVFSKLTVRENLEMGAFLRRDADGIAADLQRVHDLFPVLKERRGQAAGTLSGGEQQMLAIGRALMSRPKMLLMDEPSMGIAPKLVARIFKVIGELNRAGMPILLVEQNARAALRMASRGYVIERGRIVLADAADALLAHPDVRRAYLGE